VKKTDRIARELEHSVSTGVETAKDWATPRVEAAVNWAVPRLQQGLDTASPKIQEGLKSAAYNLADGVATVTPRLQDGLAHLAPKINDAVAKAFDDDWVKKRFGELGHTIPPPGQRTPQALYDHHKAEIDKWWPIMKAAGIKPKGS